MKRRRDFLVLTLALLVLVLAFPRYAYARSSAALPPPNLNYCEGGNYVPERCYTLFEGLQALIGDAVTSFATGTVRIGIGV
jgi:hypothetical protein